jgi:RNA polymerase sigma-70 factor (ECF subfamily)
MKDDRKTIPEEMIAGGETISDSLLLARVARGDTTSFDTLFFRHYERVYGVLFRLVGNRAEAEDLTQEAFIKLHAHARSGRFRSDENIAAWLYRVATNLGYNALRDQKRRWQRDRFLVPEPGTGPGTEQTVAILEERTAVRATLMKLPPRQAQLLVLRQVGFSYAECAEILGVSPGSIGTLLSRAGEAFRQAYPANRRGEGVD